MDDSEKLRVPSPGESEASEDAGGTLVLAATITILAGLTFFLYQIRGSSDPEEPIGVDAGRDAAGTPDISLRGVAADLEERDSKVDAGGAVEAWSPREYLAALAHGSPRLVDAMCTSVEGPLSEETLGAEAYRRLVEMTRRRSGRVPWGCLFVRRFGERRLGGAELEAALEEVWREIRSFERGESEHIARALVERVDRRGRLPEAQEFRRWLRLCALNFDAYAGSVCRRHFAGSESAESAPKDLLELVDVHLERTDWDPDYDLPVVVDALGQLAESGQPPDWRTRDEAISGYDDHLRVGAIFSLCRFVQSPDVELAERASRHLTESAGFIARAVDAKRHPRWLRACQLAFCEADGCEKKRESDPSAPALAVWSGKPDDSPVYALQSTVERGDCPEEPSRPIWYCGFRKWNGSEPGDLTDFYVATHEMEWRDSTIETEPTN